VPLKGIYFSSKLSFGKGNCEEATYYGGALNKVFLHCISCIPQCQKPAWFCKTERLPYYY